MYKTAFLVFFLLCGIGALCRTDSVRNYYKFVHKAEHLIIDSQYCAANKWYDSAFIFKEPFATDVYNQLLCKLYTGDFENALKNCCQLAEKGASRDFFKQFTPFFPAMPGKFLMSKYIECHQKFLLNVNSETIELLNRLVDADQSVHCLLPARFTDTIFVNRMRENDDSFSSILVSLLKSHGFLNEYLIGASFYNDTELSPQPLYEPLALHEIQRGGGTVDSILMQAVYQGYLKPEIAIQWLSQSMVVTRKSGLAIPINLTRGYEIYNDTLWKEDYGDTANQRLNERLFGRSSTWFGQTLRRYYLDDNDFIADERVIYNYQKGLHNKCQNKYYRFILLPQAQTAVSFKDDANVKRFYSEHTPAATN